MATMNSEYPNLEHEAYIPVLLKALHERGGCAWRGDVHRRFGELLPHRFGWRDLAMRGDGQYRWQYRTDWMRTRPVMDGLIRGDTSRGRWALTEEGERQAELRCAT